MDGRDGFAGLGRRLRRLMTEGEQPVWPPGISQKKRGFGDSVGPERFVRAAAPEGRTADHPPVLWSAV